MDRERELIVSVITARLAKWAKVMFSQASVCSKGSAYLGGGEVWPSEGLHMLGTPSPLAVMLEL